MILPIYRRRLKHQLQFFRIRVRCVILEGVVALRRARMEVVERVFIYAALVRLIGTQGSTTAVALLNANRARIAIVILPCNAKKMKVKVFYLQGYRLRTKTR